MRSVCDQRDCAHDQRQCSRTLSRHLDGTEIEGLSPDSSLGHAVIKQRKERPLAGSLESPLPLRAIEDVSTSGRAPYVGHMNYDCHFPT